MQNKARLLTITGAADTLGISLDTLRRWEKKGIITPQRTKGGVRRYTLLDLKIAKLNKRKIRFFRISSLLGKSYSVWQQNAKVVALTSLVWISGIALVHFLKPLFLSPTNPQQQILSEAIKKEAHLQLSSELANNNLPNQQDQTPGVEQEAPGVGLAADLLMQQGADTLNLEYSDIPTQYYLLPMFYSSSEEFFIEERRIEKLQ